MNDQDPAPQPEEAIGAPEETEAGGDGSAASGNAAGGLDMETVRRTLAELDDRYLRLAADFENFKRRKAQELSDSSRYASEDAVRTMLPVLDNLRRAVEHAPEAGVEEFFVNGLQLVVREFETALERLGVTSVPGVGAPFDPSIHEAIGGVESDDVEQDTVIDELVPGYRLHDRLLRPAMVRVAHPRPGFVAT